MKNDICQFRRICCLVWYELKTKCYMRENMSVSASVVLKVGT